MSKRVLATMPRIFGGYCRGFLVPRATEGPANATHRGRFRGSRF
jgi:hypothetical protein